MGMEKKTGEGAGVSEKKTGAGAGSKKTGVGVGGKKTGASGKKTVRRGARTEEEARELIERQGEINKGLYRNNPAQQGKGDGVAEIRENGEIELTDSGKINAMLTRKNLEIAMWSPIDLMDYEQVKKRLEDYFGIEERYGNKPSVSGMALALNGIGRRRIYEIVSGKFENTRGTITRLPKPVTDVIKRTYSILETLWEDNMQNGRVNPVTGIFLGKNHFGYQDRTEYVC